MNCLSIPSSMGPSSDSYRWLDDGGGLTTVGTTESKREESSPGSSNSCLGGGGGGGRKIKMVTIAKNSHPLGTDTT